MELLPRHQRIAPLLPISQNPSRIVSTAANARIQSGDIPITEVEAQEQPLPEVPAIERQELPNNEEAVAEIHSADPPPIHDAGGSPTVESPIWGLVDFVQVYQETIHPDSIASREHAVVQDSNDLGQDGGDDRAIEASASWQPLTVEET